MKNEIEIVDKAWTVSPSNWNEPWFCDQYEVYYGSKGQAKRQAVSDCNAAKDNKGEYFDFLNIRVKRCKEYDKVKYKDQIVLRYRLEELERIERIKSLPKDRKYYVQDARSYVGNAILWWGKNCSGYVCDPFKAHVFTYDEINDSEWRDTDIIWFSEDVEKGISQYVDMQCLDRNNSI